MHRHMKTAGVCHYANAKIPEISVLPTRSEYSGSPLEVVQLFRSTKIFILTRPSLTSRFITAVLLLTYVANSEKEYKLVRARLLLGCVRLGSIRNKNNWNNASKRLFGSYSHSGIPGFPFRLFCSQEQNSRNIFRNTFLFRNIPNERALG